MIMFRKLLPAAAAAAMFASVTPAAQAAVITFDEVPSSEVDDFAELEIGGLRFANKFRFYIYPDVDSDGPRPNARNGTAALMYSNVPMTIERAGGGVFTLKSLDLGTSYFAPKEAVLTWTLILADGSSETGSWDLTDSFQTFTVDRAIRGMTLNQLGSFFYAAVDNVTYEIADPIPEPTSWALMTAGFGLTGAALRRRTNVSIACA